MNLIGTALAGIYVVVATRSAFATPGQAGESAGTGGVNITCEAGQPTNATVSQPGTTVRVTCPGGSSVEGAPGTPGYSIYLDANCSRSGELSNVCPGATASTEQQDGGNADKVHKEAPMAKTIAALRFPQLPASQQVVCVKCPDKPKSNDVCEAVITVAAALPQGPQACAVGGSSITLQINKAGGSAQFKCGENRILKPTEPTEAYADDCSKVETLKDMTRSAGPKDGYVTLKVDKLKKKKLCYLCQPNASVQQQTGRQNDSCKIYVQVGGGTKLSGVPYGLALPCVAAMLRFT